MHVNRDGRVSDSPVLFYLPWCLLCKEMVCFVDLNYGPMDCDLSFSGSGP